MDKDTKEMSKVEKHFLEAIKLANANENNVQIAIGIYLIDF